jgi:hypothetical protein
VCRTNSMTSVYQLCNTVSGVLPLGRSMAAAPETSSKLSANVSANARRRETKWGNLAPPTKSFYFDTRNKSPSMAQVLEIGTALNAGVIK